MGKSRKSYADILDQDCNIQMHSDRISLPQHVACIHIYLLPMWMGKK